MPQYFAEIENGIVKRVIVANQKFIDSGLVGDAKNWIETSTDGSIGKNYAGIGYQYDNGVFIPPKGNVSFIFDGDKAIWKPPVEMPQDGKSYFWNQKLQTWVDKSNT